MRVLTSFDVDVEWWLSKEHPTVVVVSEKNMPGQWSFQIIKSTAHGHVHTFVVEIWCGKRAHAVVCD
jgi:hypothetical protein